MPEWHSFVVLFLIGLALAATPGGNMAYPMSRSMAQGRAAGFAGLPKRRPSLAQAQGRAIGVAMVLVAAMLGVDAVT